MTTQRRWKPIRRKKGRRRLPFATPHVWYLLRADCAASAPMFKLGRSCRALGAKDASGVLWLLDHRGVAWPAAAESFTRKTPGTASPGGLRVMAGGQLVSAFLVDGAWYLSAGGHQLESAGLVAVVGEHWSTTLTRISRWVEERSR